MLVSLARGERRRAFHNDDMADERITGIGRRRAPVTATTIMSGSAVDLVGEEKPLGTSAAGDAGRGRWQSLFASMLLKAGTANYQTSVKQGIRPLEALKTYVGSLTETDSYAIDFGLTAQGKVAFRSTARRRSRSTKRPTATRGRSSSAATAISLGGQAAAEDRRELARRSIQLSRPALEAGGRRRRPPAAIRPQLPGGQYVLVEVFLSSSAPGAGHHPHRRAVDESIISLPIPPGRRRLDEIASSRTSSAACSTAAASPCNYQSSCSAAAGAGAGAAESDAHCALQLLDEELEFGDRLLPVRRIDNQMTSGRPTATAAGATLLDETLRCIGFRADDVPAVCVRPRYPAFPACARRPRRLFWHHGCRCGGRYGETATADGASSNTSTAAGGRIPTGSLIAPGRHGGNR